MAKEREIYTISIVLLGNFNPVILTPYWLATKGLIRETEAETAKVEIIHPNVTRFEIDWFNIQATNNRIEFKTKRESHFSVLRDLIVSIFINLKETPISSFGINHYCHFSFRDTKEYMNFGYWLSPVEQFSEVMNEPKLLSTQYIETKNKDKTDGVVRIAISPSTLILDNKSVVFNYNHHFDNTKGTDAKQAVALMIEKWELSFQKINNINNLIWDKAKY